MVVLLVNTYGLNYALCNIMGEQNVPPYVGNDYTTVRLATTASLHFNLIKMCSSQMIYTMGWTAMSWCGGSLLYSPQHAVILATRHSVRPPLRALNCMRVCGDAGITDEDAPVQVIELLI